MSQLSTLCPCYSLPLHPKYLTFLLCICHHLIGRFSFARQFPDVTNLSVENAVIMSNMFDSTANFDQDISGWNVASVTEFTGMYVQPASSLHDLLNGSPSLLPVSASFAQLI